MAPIICVSTRRMSDKVSLFDKITVTCREYSITYPLLALVDTDPEDTNKLAYAAACDMLALLIRHTGWDDELSTVKLVNTYGHTHTFEIIRGEE